VRCPAATRQETGPYPPQPGVVRTFRYRAVVKHVSPRKDFSRHSDGVNPLRRGISVRDMQQWRAFLLHAT